MKNIHVTPILLCYEYSCVLADFLFLKKISPIIHIDMAGLLCGLVCAWICLFMYTIIKFKHLIKFIIKTRITTSIKGSSKIR